MVGTTLNSLVVGLGELKYADQPGEELTCLGLGSCVAISAWDRINKQGAMAHVVLPECNPGREPSPKFADIAVPELIENLKKMGAVPSRLEIKLVGGAHMTPASAPGIPAMRIGDRNIEAVKAQLKKLGLRAKAENLGGNNGRTVRLDVESGRVTVVIAGTELTNL
ncbi:MAG: chemotaxis protein CheD [Chloroflexi bacterium]|nr:chemotaxis protein CheD [Chloroflexota bacterium]MCI0873386.1 chemotaxis protein CheD [Chloroflexota bacterium]